MMLAMAAGGTMSGGGYSAQALAAAASLSAAASGTLATRIGAGREAAISLSVVCEKISSSTRCPSSHTRNIRQAGCKAQELEPSTHTLSVIGPSTASITP